MAHDHRGRPIADPHMHVVEAMRSQVRKNPSTGGRVTMLDTGREGQIDPEDLHGFSFFDEGEDDLNEDDY